MPDTIVALATPTGRSGIGIIRLSGGESLNITCKLVNDPNFFSEPRTAHLKQLHDLATGEMQAQGGELAQPDHFAFDSVRGAGIERNFCRL